ncbi:hypothetical protein HZS61_014482 [Fusarium oxysporum f. sp. conglutinans]|uniref:Uncharacterized protein n=2 Tax=Fusarium oxysporum TaxID=5507 RepID=A0A8H6GRP3_FUSOX|nr:hypothetical protein HZS61_014482 [Fusarium oxysporum f. sp. conglutinans]KAG7434169.1 hypothetical protein Forpi1262_v005204 [Fusarium oxysporum f. sp. raphani]
MAQEHATIVDLMQRGPCKAESSFKYQLIFFSEYLNCCDRSLQYFLTHIHSALLLLQETRCRFDNIDRDSKNLTFHHYQATDLLGLSQRHLSMSY